MKQRNPNYELLRIIAILLISLMHGIKSAYGSENPINSFACVGVNAIGNMGVTVFVLISGYFGIKFRPSKFIQLWGIVLFYSLLVFAADCYVYDLPRTLSTKAFLVRLYTSLTPITSGTSWFITSYMILFLLAPLINKGIDNITKKQFQYLLLTLLFFYSISPTFLMHSLSNTPNGKCTENMILAYLIGRYIAKFGAPQLIQRYHVALGVSCVLLIFCVNYFLFDAFFMAKDHNFFIILGAVCFFLAFQDLHIQSDAIGNTIRTLATFVFPFYLMNWALIGYLEPQYAHLHNESTYLPLFLLVQIEVIVISIVTEQIRRMLLDKPIQALGKYIDTIVDFNQLS